MEIRGAGARSAIVGGSTSFDPIIGGYGQLYLPDCNDPEPWNNYEIFYLDGIELPMCSDLYPDPCDFGACGGGGGGPPPPTTTQVIPGRLLIGQVANVTINGSGYDASAVPALSGSGVSISNVQVVSSTQIAATFTLALNATPGNHSVTVNTNSSPELDGGTAFFVQIPSTVQVVGSGVSHAYGPAANGCLTNYGGMEGAITYQILDQDTPPSQWQAACRSWRTLQILLSMANLLAPINPASGSQMQILRHHSPSRRDGL